MEYTDNELEQSIEETRQDIEEKRASMSEKLELLEERVRDTLEETRSAVEDIVENVKGTVDNTVGAVKETVEGARSTVDNLVENVKDTMEETTTMVKKSFDLNYQVEQRPWVMFGGSVLIGFMLGSWMQRGTSDQRKYFDRGYHYDDYSSDSLYTAPIRNGASLDDLDETAESNEQAPSTSIRNARTTTMSSAKPHRWNNLTGQFQEEWDALKEIALGTLMGTLRTMVRQHMPSVAPKLEHAINSASVKLGTEPIDPASSQHQSQGQNSYSQPQEPHGAEERATSASASEMIKPSWQSGQGSTNPSTPHNRYS